MTGWSPERIEAFRRGFTEFSNCVFINSKELGGRTCLGEHIYRAQNWILDAVCEALINDQHELAILKSRQLGASTFCRALSLFWLGIHQGLQGALVFDTAYNTAAARREIINVIKNLPDSISFPRIANDNRDALILENESQILFMAAGVKQSKTGGGLGRSVGLNYLHASELCSWQNDEGVTSLRQSLSETYPNRFYLYESTARGFNVWHDIWVEAEQDDAKRTLFLGWWSKDNQIIKRGSLEFYKYGMQPPTPSETKRIEAVKELYGWDITPEQLAWYRKKSDPTQEREEGDTEDSIFVQEQPFTSEEAFQQTGASFFESEVLTENSVRIASGPKPQVYKFLPGVSSLVECDWTPARYRRDVELRVWEEPVRDSTYVVAGDPAFGHNENNNNSAVQVLRCFADGIDQVAEYATATIRPHQLSWLLWSLVGWYALNGQSRVLMICELNGPGEEVWRQYDTTRKLIQSGYLRVLAEKKGIENIAANVRNYVFQRSDAMSGSGHAYQWVTSGNRKVQIMEALRNYLSSGTLLVRSMETIEEMKTITREGDAIGAPGSKRDDRSFALALGIRAWDEKLRRGLNAGNRTREAERARLSASIVDQYALFSQNQLLYYLKDKERARQTLATQMLQANWRRGTGGTGMRRNLPARRF